MWRELQDFGDTPQRERVIVVRAAGDFGGQLPAGLQERYPQIELVDLREASRWAVIAPWRAARLSDELLKIVGPLLDIAPERMPDLRQEQERRQAARTGAAVGVGSALALAAVAAAVTAQRGEQRAVQALQDALFATERAIVAVERALPPVEGADSVGDSPRGRVLDDMCDLRSRVLDESAARGGLQELRICEAERARSLLLQGETGQAHDRLERMATTLYSAMAPGGYAEATVQWLRGCDTIADLAPARLQAAGCDAAAQELAVRRHAGEADFGQSLARRQIGLAESRRRKADAAVAVDDYKSAVNHWRAAASHYGQARSTETANDQQQRIQLDEAATWIAIAAFEAALKRHDAAGQARQAARQLLDAVQAAAPKDPDVLDYAGELDRKWGELATQAGTGSQAGRGKQQ
jgi:hypothetical protein